MWNLLGTRTHYHSMKVQKITSVFCTVRFCGKPVLKLPHEILQFCPMALVGFLIGTLHMTQNCSKFKPELQYRDTEAVLTSVHNHFNQRMKYQAIVVKYPGRSISPWNSHERQRVCPCNVDYHEWMDNFHGPSINTAIYRLVRSS